jgi:hypothetical protein
MEVIELEADTVMLGPGRVLPSGREIREVVKLAGIVLIGEEELVASPTVFVIELRRQFPTPAGQETTVTTLGGEDCHRRVCR